MPREGYIDGDRVDPALMVAGFEPVGDNLPGHGEFALGETTVYTKSASKKGFPGLVIDPNLAPLRSLLMDVAGVVIRGGYYFNPRLKRFPVDRWTRKPGKAIHRGFLVVFETEEAVYQTARALAAYARDGMEAAESVLAGAEQANRPQTGRETAVVQRVGQAKCRRDVIALWGDGELRLASAITPEEQMALALDGLSGLRWLHHQHAPYLAYHRAHIFRG